MTPKNPTNRLGAFCAALLLTGALSATAQAAPPSVTVDGTAYLSLIHISEPTRH